MGPLADATARLMRPVAGSAISTKWNHRKRPIRIHAMTAPSTATHFATPCSDQAFWFHIFLLVGPNSVPMSGRWPVVSRADTGSPAACRHPRHPQYHHMRGMRNNAHNVLLYNRSHAHHVAMGPPASTICYKDI